MSATAELNRLAARKERVQRRIAASRASSVAACRRLAPTLERADAILANLRTVAPYVRFGATACAPLFRTRRKPTLVERVTAAVRWAPLVVKAVRAFSAFRR